MYIRLCIVCIYIYALMHLREERVGINKQMTWGLYVLHIQVCMCSTEYLTSMLRTLSRTFQYSCNNVWAPSPGSFPGTAGHPLPSHRVICEPPPQGRGAQGRDSAPGLGGVQPVFGRDKTPPQHPPFIPGFLFAFVLTHKTIPPGTAAVRQV